MGHTMIYDSTKRIIFLFGGSTDVWLGNELNDLWIYNFSNNNWTELN